MGADTIVMTSQSEKQGLKGLLAGVLALLGLGIVAAGAWFVLGPGAGTGPEEADAASTHQSTKATPAHAIEAALGAARSYQASEEFAKAEAVLRAAVEEHVDDQALRLAYAEVLLNLERAADAYEQYEAALAIGPQDAAIEFQAGTLASSIGKPERALEHFSMARAAEPGSAEIALYLGVTQHRLGLVDEAKVSLLAAVKLDDEEPVAPAVLAQIALDENEPDLALRYIRRSREIDPTQLAHRILEARILRRLNKPEEALTLMLALPKEQLHEPVVLEICSGCMGLLGRPADAAALYEEALAAQPTNADLAFQAAQWHERAGDTEAALAKAKMAQMLGHELAGKMAERLSGG